MAELEKEADGSRSLLGPRVIGVCVGKEKDGLHALKWALENIVPPQGSIHLLHVRSPLRWIPGPMGGKVPVDKVNPELVKQFKEERFMDTKKLVNEYVKLCEKKKVTSKLCYSENDSVLKELVDQISNLGITNIVLETSPSSFLRVRKTENIPAYVAKYAPEFCTVMVVRKGKLYSVKDATRSSSFQCSSGSISIASDLGISMASDSASSGEIIVDTASVSRQAEKIDMQPDIKVDMRSTPQGTPRASSSMDISQSSPEWFASHSFDRHEHQSPSGKSVIMRNYSTPSQIRFLEAELAPSFYHQSWSPHGSNRSQSIGGFESRASLASDCGFQEELFSRACLENLHDPSISPAAKDRFHTSIDSPDCDSLSQISMDIGHSPSLRTVERLSECAGTEVLPALEFDLLQSQLNEAKQSAHWAQRQADKEAINFKMAEEVVVNARKMIAEHERHRVDALSEAKSALQRALDYEKWYEEALSSEQMALRHQQILQERLAEEIRKREETQSELESQRRMVDTYAMEVDLAKQQAQEGNIECKEAFTQLADITRQLEEESQLRKEAEKKASQEAILKCEALSALRKEQRKYMEYSFGELQFATNNFQEENKLGQGGYGPVYKGKLHHTTVAVKVLATEDARGRGEFQKELEVLSCIHHPHMVMLLGACPEKGCIVYEYMANGSLEDRLNCRDGTTPLPWYVRFRICLEVATALLFLHSRPQPIVHRDLKPGNILLDHHFVSKIGDVGIAKLVPGSLTFTVTMYKETVIVGTWAYMDPDYQRTGVVSCESDIYALGIVMLQLLTGQPAVGVVDLVEDALDENRLEDVLDKSAGEWPLAEAMALACVSLQCAEPRRKNRPKLETKVLPDLESIQGVACTAAASVGPSPSGTMPSIPSSFFCPISQDIMENPHLAADGFTYEHDAIKVWLQEHDTSPMTNLMLSHKNLLPNYTLRSAIKEWYDNGLIAH